MIEVEPHKPKKKYLPEIITLLLYMSALVLIMYYHEPWFDEAQAWLIARDASFVQLVTSITHYEGHPPIWFLILMPFAKLGVPFELGLKIVNFSLVTVAMGIFIFKAPFPGIIRCTVPFTYFFFYQYGVISRPYSLMLLGFVLSALFFKERNEKPFRFITGLAIICSASVYGIIIAAGITVVWLWEIFATGLYLKEFTEITKSNTFYALLGLFIFTVLLLATVYPYSDVYAIDAVVQKRDQAVWLLYMLFVAPAEAVCAPVFSDISYSASLVSQIYGLVASCIINVTLFYFTKSYGRAALFVIPYLALVLFGGLIYFSPVHLGILTMFYMFLMWCCLGQKRDTYANVEIDKFFRYVGKGILVVGLGTSLYWSLTAAYNEVALNYGTGRETANYLKTHGLDQLKIMVAWNQNVDPATGASVSDYSYLDGIPVLAYFNENIFINFNEQANDKCYLLHRTDSLGIRTNRLIADGAPDVLLITSSPAKTFGDKIRINDYSLVKSIQGGNSIWKDQIIENRLYIFLRKDLLPQYPDIDELDLGNEILKDKKWNSWGNALINREAERAS